METTQKNVNPALKKFRKEPNKLSANNDTPMPANPAKKVGAFVGKFLPPHAGHISVIDRALAECDEVVVVISDNAKRSKALCKENNFPYFSAKKRLKWLKNHYKNRKNMSFYRIDERKLKLKPFNNDEYAKLFWKCVKAPVNVKYADENYRELNEQSFKNCTFVPVDREAVPVHGTDIRSGKNLNYIIDEAKPDILKNAKFIKKHLKNS